MLPAAARAIASRSASGAGSGAPVGDAAVSARARGRSVDEIRMAASTPVARRTAEKGTRIERGDDTPADGDRAWGVSRAMGNVQWERDAAALVAGGGGLLP